MELLEKEQLINRNKSFYSIDGTTWNNVNGVNIEKYEETKTELIKNLK